MNCLLSAIMAKAPPEVQGKLQSLTLSQVEFHAEKLVRTLMGRPNHCSTLSNYVTGKDSEGYHYGRQKSFRFRLIPEERGYPNSVLYDYIVVRTTQTSGGSVTRKADDPFAVTILNDLYYILRENENIVLPSDCYSSSLIYEAIKREMFDLPLPDPKAHLLSPSKYEPYDLWKILRREVKWTDLNKSKKQVESEAVTARKSARMIYEILSADKDTILKWKQICGIEPSTSSSVAVVPATSNGVQGGNQEEEKEMNEDVPELTISVTREDNAASAIRGERVDIPAEEESLEEEVVPTAATTSPEKEIHRQKSKDTPFKNRSGDANAAAATSSTGGDHPGIIETRKRQNNLNDENGDDDHEEIKVKRKRRSSKKENDANAALAVATATVTTPVAVAADDNPPTSAFPSPERDHQEVEKEGQVGVTPKKKSSTLATLTETSSPSPIPCSPPQRNPSEIETLNSSLIMNTPESQRHHQRQIQIVRVTPTHRNPDVAVICSVPSAPNSPDRNEGRRFRRVGGRPVAVRDPVKLVQEAVAGPPKREIHKKSVPVPGEDGWIDPDAGVETTTANVKDDDDDLDVSQLVHVQFSDGEDENQESFIAKQIRKSRPTRHRQRSCFMTPKKQMFAEEEEFLIVRKICQVKAFRYTGGIKLYEDMAKSKDFAGKRTGVALHDRFRKFIRPKLLDEKKGKVFAKNCGISSEDLNELMKGLQITNLSKHRNVAPNFKFD